jgi:hypothetical protein
LADDRELSKRRTKTLVNTCSPQWNQSFVYPGIRPTDLRSRVLEVTVWDYDRFGANEFLGEVCLDLGSMLTTGQDVEPVWHSLNLYENGSALVRLTGGETSLRGDVGARSNLNPRKLFDCPTRPLLQSECFFLLHLH